MADFTLTVQGGGSRQFSGDSRFMLDDQTGVLTVYDESGVRFRYSPAFWTSIEDKPDTSVPVIGEVHFG